jgi:hypothetical protein
MPRSVFRRSRCDAFRITESRRAGSSILRESCPVVLAVSLDSSVTQRAASEPAAAARIREAFAPSPFGDAGALVPSTRVRRD